FVPIPRRSRPPVHNPHPGFAASIHPGELSALSATPARFRDDDAASAGQPPSLPGVLAPITDAPRRPDCHGGPATPIVRCDVFPATRR
ncbi:hypothetical protein GWI33_008732, partial [Rhynchophorus ferrugineus]